MVDATSSAGYAGPVTDEQYARILGGSFPWVSSKDDFVVTPGPGTLQITVSAGRITGYGIEDVFAAATLTATAPSAGSEWWAVIVRRTYTSTPPKSEVLMVKGSAAYAFPASLNLAMSNIGGVHDIVLWMVRFTSGLTAVQERVDHRPFGGGTHLVLRDLTGANAPLLPDWAPIGVFVTRNDEEWRHDYDDTGPHWKMMRPAPDDRYRYVERAPAPDASFGTSGGSYVSGTMVGVQPGKWRIKGTAVVAVGAVGNAGIIGYDVRLMVNGVQRRFLPLAGFGGAQVSHDIEYLHTQDTFGNLPVNLTGFATTSVKACTGSEIAMTWEGPA